MVNHVDLDSVLREYILKEMHSPAVDGLTGQDPLAPLHKTHHSCGDCSHSRRQDKRVFRSFKGTDLVLHMLCGWIAPPCVHMTSRLARY